MPSSLDIVGLIKSIGLEDEGKLNLALNVAISAYESLLKVELRYEEMRRKLLVRTAPAVKGTSTATGSVAGGKAVKAVEPKTAVVPKAKGPTVEEAVTKKERKKKHNLLMQKQQKEAADKRKATRKAAHEKRMAEQQEAAAKRKAKKLAQVSKAGTAKPKEDSIKSIRDRVQRYVSAAVTSFNKESDKYHGILDRGKVSAENYRHGLVWAAVSSAVRKLPWFPTSPTGYGIPLVAEGSIAFKKLLAQYVLLPPEIKDPSMTYHDAFKNWGKVIRLYNDSAKRLNSRWGVASGTAGRRVNGLVVEQELAGGRMGGGAVTRGNNRQVRRQVMWDIPSIRTDSKVSPTSQKAQVQKARERFDTYIIE